MNTKYRTNAISGRDLASLFLSPSISFTIIDLCAAVDFTKMDKNEYDSWISDWKETYKRLSQVITSIKKNHNPVTQRQAAYIRVLANTLLNARQYAKDTRRGYFANIKEAA